uniref:Ferritin n=1 Tax=Oncorhynchus kisutch TaxID=8019 RepID=A0A8C7IPX8_ONCKI
MESQIRQNYHHDCEAAINRMINLEMFASYTYTSMAFYFSRDDVALPGFAHFFKENSDEEREHAEKLLSFQNKRGGRILLQDIKKPERDEWGNGLEAMQCALQLEKNVNQALLDLHKIASDKVDPHMESQIRQNYHHDCEAAINRMINLEMFASYTYTSMAFYFSRDDVALRGFAHFFKENSDEEREHAEKLLSFQNKRGGRILLQDIKKPERDEWGNGLEAMQCALQLEKNVNQALLDLHKIASDKVDPHMESQIRQNYHHDCEAAINRMINLEMFASYTYTSMAFYFSRDDVALRGFAHFFKENSDEEREHADKLLSFQNKRGGRILLQDIKKPERDEWGNGLEAMQCALQLEKNVNQALLDLHKIASDKVDPHLCDFLETHYLNEQVEAIKKLGDHITNLTKMDAVKNKMGEYLFDKHTLGGQS